MMEQVKVCKSAYKEWYVATIGDYAMGKKTKLEAINGLCELVYNMLDADNNYYVGERKNNPYVDDDYVKRLEGLTAKR